MLPPSPAPRDVPAQRRWPWILASVLALVAVAITIAAAWLPGAIETRVRTTVQARLAERLDAEVQVGDVSARWGRVEITDVRVGDEDAPLVTLDKIVVELDPSALWRGYAIARRAELSGGRIVGSREALERLARNALTRRGDRPDREPGRIRPIPDRIRIAGVTIAIDDGPRHVSGAIDMTVLPKSRQIDVEIRDARLTQGRREVVAGRIATSVQIRGGKLPVPLKVQLDNLGTRLTPRIAVAGVSGTVTVHDEDLQDVSLDLSGGFSDREDADAAAQLWSVVGRVRRDFSRGRLTLDMDAFELGRVPEVLRNLPVTDSEGATIGGRVAVELGAGIVRIDGEVTLDGLHVRHPTLARHTVHDVGFALRVAAEIEPAARRVRVPFAELQRSGVSLLARAELSHPADPTGRHYHVELDVPPRPCQAVLDAIPSELAPALQGFALDGEFSAWTRVDVDYADLENLVLEGDVGAWGCKVVTPPEAANAARLASSFTHRVTMRDGRVRSVDLHQGSGSFTPLSEISPYLVGAVLTTEDGGFYRHRGFLPSQFKTALERNLRAGKVRLGASTISMQMIKNVWLSHERTLSRKLQEMFLTWYVETVLSKQRILEIYLNIVELGPGIYGVTRAAQHYFGKHPSELTPPEAAYLALMLPSPVRRHVHYCNGALSESFKVKLHRILGLMRAKGRIDDLEWEVHQEGHIEFDLRDRGSTGACLAEIDALMSAMGGQRALTGILPPPDDLDLVVEDEMPPPSDRDADAIAQGEDPASADAPGRPAMDDLDHGDTESGDETW